MKFPLLHSLKMSLAGLCLLAAPLARGCGVDWTVPSNHFEGVNAQGYVSYWEKVGEVDFGAQNGDPFKLPLIIGFRSDFETVSPYLGKGWILGLLESRIVQVEENRFLMTQPDGWQRWFWREKPGETTLKGQGNWMAEIKGNTISAWADCGWRLDYVKGKIVAITTPKNRKLEFDYNGNAVVAVRENGVTRLAVETDAAGNPSALVFNGKRLEIAQGEKPRVQVIAGQNVVGGMDRSLKKLAGSQGPSDHFEFAVNPKLQPTLKITSNAGTERLITWDPATKLITADGVWTYEVIQTKSSHQCSAIAREGTEGRQFWHQQNDIGKETETLLNGTTRVTWRFVGQSSLAGRIRKIEETSGVPPNRESRTSKWIYDERGQLLSIRHSDGSIISYQYDNKGRFLQAKKDDTLIWERRYSSNGTLIYEMLNK
jgi:YD repeat-containing protein